MVGRLFRFLLGQTAYFQGPFDVSFREGNPWMVPTRGMLHPRRTSVEHCLQSLGCWKTGHVFWDVFRQLFQQSDPFNIHGCCPQFCWGVFWNLWFLSRVRLVQCCRTPFLIETSTSTIRRQLGIHSVDHWFLGSKNWSPKMWPIHSVMLAGPCISHQDLHIGVDLHLWYLRHHVNT